MAREYAEKLTSLISELGLENEISSPLEVKHFFSGAALYVSGQICASWSPVGLAFKLSEQEAHRLMASGEAQPLRYFANGHIKKGYALFENPGDYEAIHWKSYLLKAIRA